MQRELGALKYDFSLGLPANIVSKILEFLLTKSALLLTREKNGLTEQSYDRYKPQETRRVTVVSGKVATVSFNNELKRGDIQVMRLQDSMVQSMKSVPQKTLLLPTALRDMPQESLSIRLQPITTVWQRARNFTSVSTK